MCWQGIVSEFVLCCFLEDKTEGWTLELQDKENQGSDTAAARRERW